MDNQFHLHLQIPCRRNDFVMKCSFIIGNFWFLDFHSFCNENKVGKFRLYSFLYNLEGCVLDMAIKVARDILIPHCMLGLSPSCASDPVSHWCAPLEVVGDGSSTPIMDMNWHGPISLFFFSCHIIYKRRKREGGRERISSMCCFTS